MIELAKQRAIVETSTISDDSALVNALQYHPPTDDRVQQFLSGDNVAVVALVAGSQISDEPYHWLLSDGESVLYITGEPSPRGWGYPNTWVEYTMLKGDGMIALKSVRDAFIHQLEKGEKWPSFDEWYNTQG